MSAIVVVRGGVAETVRGETYTLDMDNFNTESVDGKADAISELVQHMEDNNMIDDDTVRESIHKKLDEIMDALLAVLSGEEN